MGLKTYLESEREERLDQLRSHFAWIGTKRKSAQDALAELDAEEKRVEAAYARGKQSLPGAVCVRCWIMDGEAIELTPRSSEDPEVDAYSCSRCGEAIEVDTN